MSIIKKVDIFSFHVENKHTGEAESLITLEKFLSRAGVIMRVCPRSLKRILQNEDFSILPRGENIFTKSLKFLNAMVNLNYARTDADIVHVFLPVPFLSFIVRGLKTKRVITIEAPISCITLRELFSLLPFDFLFYLSRFLLNNNRLARFLVSRKEHYVVSTDYQRMQLQSIGICDSNIAVIPNICDSARYTKMDATVSREKNNIKGSPLIAYVGHFLHYKGIESLIKAFYLLSSDIKESRLVLAWSGLGDVNRVKKLIGEYGLDDKVFLRKKVDVPSVLSACDILALPYLVDYGTVLYPSTLLECFNIGVPLVCSDVTSLRDVVKDGETAAVFKTGDVFAMKKAMVNLWENERLRERIIFRQREIAREMLAPEKLVRKYTQLYGEICKK